MAFSWILRKRKPSSSQEASLPADEIILRVEGGLLMSFGPDGDPLPPDLVRSICAADPGETLKMETGQEVDRSRVLAIMDAQQKGPTSEHRHSGWVKAMLGLAGGFEDTPADLLATEPAGAKPPEPVATGSDRPASEWLTPLTFDDTETASVARADAVLVHGLGKGMRLSAGRFEPRLDGWVVRPNQLPSLAVKRTDGADDHVTIDVTAISIKGDGDRWPVASRQLRLA